MDWLYQQIDRLLIKKVRQENVTRGGNLVGVTVKYEDRFLKVMLQQHLRWCIGIFLAALVSLFSFCSGNGDFFASLGAVNVLIGVLFANSQISKVRQKHSETIAMDFLEVLTTQLDEVLDEKSGHVSGYGLPNGVKEDLQQKWSDLARNSEGKLKPYHLLEVGIVSFGTLQWAFGEWLVEVCSQ